MILIVGLGNPGSQYVGTRHNVGFMVLDRLASKFNVLFTKAAKYDAFIARPDKKDVFLVKPQTYMNLSGQAVDKLATFYKAKSEDIWVVYDDVDLPLGAARVRGKGTGETRHHGVRSIMEPLGTADFPRFRVGIAPSAATSKIEGYPLKPSDLKKFVLEPFDKREQPLVERAIAWIVDEILFDIKQGYVTAKTLNG
jgi:PTH1 family peptidyl-tRNA hydrolase